MVTNVSGYIVFSIFSIAFLLIYSKKNKKTFNLYKGLSLCLLLLGTMFVFVKTFFPLPVQSIVIKSGYHRVDNYLIPFERIYANFIHSASGTLNWKYIIESNLTFIGVSIISVLPFGLFLAAYIKDFKKSLMYYTITAFLVEILQYIIGLVIGLNYKSVSSEDIIYFIIGSLLGYCIYKAICKLTKKWQNYSDVLKLIYRTFSGNMNKITKE